MRTEQRISVSVQGYLSPLKDLCLGFGGKALPESSYKRLQRFFREFELDYAQLAHLVVSWLQIPDDWVLSLDRPTWKLGTQWDNILTLGIGHQGVTFPVLWWLLDKRGNSNSDERMRLMETFAKRFLSARVQYLCADREFIGQAWVRSMWSKIMPCAGASKPCLACSKPVASAWNPLTSSMMSD